MQKPAKRMEHIPFSGVRSIFEKANELEKQGKEIIHLEIGRPDFDTPQHIKEAAQEAIVTGKVHYTSNYGIEPLRKAISRKLLQENELSYNPDGEIIVTMGVSEGIMMSMLAMLNPGDEVLIPEPLFPCYLMSARMAGAIPIPVPANKNNYQPDIANFKEKVTDKTRMLVITNPGNPTGQLIPKEALSEISKFAIRHNLLVLADEIYEKIVYDGNKHISIASLPGMRNRTITLNGFSKTYSMTGWRLGYVAANERIINALIRIHQYSVVCGTTFAQWGGIAALESSQQCVETMVEEFDRRRSLIIRELSKIQGLKFAQPNGAFYVYIDIRGLNDHSMNIADNLLNQHHVAVVPWDENHIRLSYANSYENISKAMQKVQNALLCPCI